MPRNRVHYAWIVLAMGTAAVFGVLGLARFGYSIILPSMQEGLRMSNTQAGLLATANLAGYLALSALGGALASRFGPRAVISSGLAVAGAGMLLTGTAGSFGEALAWRTLTGMGSGAGNVSVMGLMSAWFGPRRRGFATGIGVTGSSIALIATGPFVPFVISAGGASGWRTCWHVFGAFTLALAAAGYAILRDHPEEKGLRPLGAEAASGPLPVAAPSGLSSVYRSLQVWKLGLVYVSFGFSYIIYMTFFVKRLIADAGYSQKEAGSLFMLMGWFSLLCGLIWGTVSDRIGRKNALMIVYLIHTAAFTLFALLPTPAGFTVSAVLFGLSAWSIAAIMAAACGDITGPRMAPAAVGFITVFFGVGQAVGPVVAGALADTSGSFRGAFLLAAAVALLGALGASMLKKEKS